MVESGAFPSRTDAFPAGLRVLVVDDDLTWLKILEKMLKKCSYQVTTCCLAREALSLLRERRDGFDIVISDVNMPDMNGFKLLEYVGLEMDLPVIMMSVDWETSKVMKGVQHGACDYLLKPIKMKELRNIWQHVVRKKIHEVKEIESLEHRGADIQMLISEMDHFEDKYFEMGALRRRKDPENKRHVDDLGVVDSLTSKKARVVWSVDLHRRFVDAVNQIGIDKVGPKKVLTLMNVPGLTRENVASHLQKYRLYLSRMQKEEAMKQQQQDFSCADSVGGFGLESKSSIGQNNDVVTVSDFGYTMPVTSMGPSALQGDLEGIVPFMPVTKPKTALTAEGMDIKYEPTLQIEQWDHEATLIQQLWDPKQQLLEPYGHFQANPFALSPKSSFPERDKLSSIDMPSPSAHYSQNDSNLSSVALPAMNQETLEAVTSMTKWEPFLQEPISGDSKNALAIATQNIDFSEYCYNNPELFAELQTHCYDELGFHCDRFEVPMENPVLEQGLFMVDKWRALGMTFLAYL